jgi:hypothetical protein
MKCRLIIPRPPVAKPDGQSIISREVFSFPLRWTNHHPAASYGLGVVLSPNNRVLDAHAFRYLRDAVGAYIITDDPERVHAALGLEPGERGVWRKPLPEVSHANR